MRHSEILLTFAEIAVAFAGFASLISLLGRGARGIDVTRLLGMVRTGLLVTGFSLFPFVPHALGASEGLSWRLSAVLYCLASGAHTAFAWRQLYQMWQRGEFVVRAGYFTFPMGAVGIALALSAALVASPERAAGLYLASLATLLSVSGVLFLGVFTSFVRARASERDG